MCGPVPPVVKLLSARGHLPEHGLPSWLGPSMDCGSTLTSLCSVTAPPRSQAGPLDVPILLLPLLVVSGSLALQPGLQDKEGRAATGCWGHPRGHDPHADPRRKHAQRACEAAGSLRLLAPRNRVSGRARRRVRGRGPAATFARLTFCPALPGTRTCRGSPSADSPRRGKLGEKTTRL